MSSEDRDSLFLSESPACLRLQLLNGTNLAPDTAALFQIAIGNSDIDFAVHRESPGWSRRVEILMEEFRQLRTLALPVGAVILESRVPRFGENGWPFALRREEARICSGGGASWEFSFAYDPATKELAEGLFPVLDGKGNPLILPNGRPIGVRFGLFRQITVVERARAVSDNRQMLTAQLSELCSEAGEILLQIPAECLRRLWHRWGQIRNTPSTPKYRWLDTLFEFEWSNTKGKTTSRCVWHSGETSSLVLHDEGLFPRIPPDSIEGSVLAHRFPSEAGYPFTWGSELEDVVSSTISLLRWISTGGWTGDSVDERSSGPAERGVKAGSQTSGTHAATDRTGTNVMEKKPGTVFIGHGRSNAWWELKEFLQNRLHLPWDEFNRESAAGLATKERLKAMLEKASFAFLVMTAEDEQADGSVQARANVIHEVGLFQGRLGFERAIVLLEEGCEEFSNIVGLGQIRFP